MNEKTDNFLYVQNREDWREWLAANFTNMRDVWLVFYKKETGQPSLPYEDAVEEALCFGWIDSIVKKIDEERYARLLTPRHPRSVWSELNKKRAEKMIAQGRMTSAGLARINEAKLSGEWDTVRTSVPEVSYDMPSELEQALKENETARQNFTRLSLSLRKQYLGWINHAKRPETRSRRIKETIELLERNETLGMR